MTSERSQDHSVSIHLTKGSTEHLHLTFISVNNIICIRPFILLLANTICQTNNENKTSLTYDNIKRVSFGLDSIESYNQFLT